MNKIVSILLLSIINLSSFPLFVKKLYSDLEESDPGFIATKNMFTSGDCYSGEIKTIFGNCYCPKDFIVDSDTGECLPKENWFFHIVKSYSDLTEENNIGLSTYSLIIGGEKDRPTRVFSKIDTIPADLRKKVPATALAKDPASPSSDCYNPDNPEGECYSGPGGPYYATPDLVALEEDPTDANITEYITDDGNETGISVMISVPANEKVIKSVSLSNTILKKLKEKNIGEKQIDRKLRLIRSLLEKVEVVENPIEEESNTNDLSWATGVLTRAELNKLVYLWEQEKTNREYISLLENANVSAIEDFSYLFYDKPDFNINISSWDVSNGKDFSYMFAYASSFNQDISSWDVSKGETFEGMFAWASAFDTTYISNWAFSLNVNTKWITYSDTFNENKLYELASKCMDISIEEAASRFNSQTRVWSGDFKCINIENLSDIDLLYLTAIKEITGSFSLITKTDSITNLDGLVNLEKVGGSIYLRGWSIKNMQGLQNLKHVGSTISILYTNIDDLYPLKNLEYIGSYLMHKNPYSRLDNPSPYTTPPETKSTFQITYKKVLPADSLLCSQKDALRYQFGDRYDYNFLNDYRKASVCDVDLAKDKLKAVLQANCGFSNKDISLYVKENSISKGLGCRSIGSSYTFDRLGYNSVFTGGKVITRPLDSNDSYVFRNIKEIDGSLYFITGKESNGDLGLTHIDGFSSLEKVTGSVYLQEAYNTYLGSIEGLSNLKYIGGYLILDQLKYISDYKPLEQLEFVKNEIRLPHPKYLENGVISPISKDSYICKEGKIYIYNYGYLTPELQNEIFNYCQ